MADNQPDPKVFGIMGGTRGTQRQATQAQGKHAQRKAPKPGIRSANHCTLCQFYYCSFFFLLFLFPSATLSDWPSFMRFPASEASDGSHSLLLLQLNNWIILTKGNLEGRKCFSFISFYLKCLKVCLKICSCQTGYMAKLEAGLAISYKPDFFFQSLLFTILQIQSFHTPFVFCSAICCAQRHDEVQKSSNCDKCKA